MNPTPKIQRPGRSWHNRTWHSRVGTGLALATLLAQGLLAPAQDTSTAPRTNEAAATNTLPHTNGPSPQISGPNSTNTLTATNEVATTRSPLPAPNTVQTNRSTRVDYSAFKIITDRNIFDPNRSPRRRGGGPRTPPKVTESFSLVGTMSYEKGTFAFFDGSSTAYRKVLKPTEVIAGYKVTDIAPNCVKLASGTNQLELHVGMQVRREDEGEWRLSGHTESYGGGGTTSTTTSTTTSATTSATTSPASASTPASSGDEDEVLKRLRQKREQELSK